MIWLLWLVGWLVQLHLLQATPWLGVVWPLFATLTLLASRHMSIYKLSWCLGLLGILADISSHLPRGIVLRSYLVLIIGVWLMHWLAQRFAKYDGRLDLIIVAVVSGVMYLSMATSWRSLFFMATHELIVGVLMTVITYGIVRFVLRFSYA